MGLDSALVSAVGAVPAGVVVPFAGATSPSGWLLCHGQAVSRTDYGALFTAIGTTYGTGDGSTTFNLPDLRGRVVAGLDNMGGSAASRLTSTTITGGGDNLGEVGGAQTHTHGSSTMTAAMNLFQASGTNYIDYSRVSGDSYTENTRMSMPAGGTFNTGHNENATEGVDILGSTDSTSTVQPTMVLNYIIKASAY